MRHPRPRQKVYDLYWYFASERMRAFENRLAGQPPPWSSDGILQTYKFCNTYRALDRVSQYLIQQVAYDPEPVGPEDRLFQITAFRTFSRPETWDVVRSRLGGAPRVSHLRSGEFLAALEHAKQRNGGLYTGAFILCATDAYGHSVKHLNHVELFRHMFVKDRLGARLLEARKLRDVYDLLHRYPLMGDFMSYQTAIDLNYCEHINFSEDEFTQPGPGALRGLNKVFESLGDLTPADAVSYMVDRQETEFRRLGLSFAGLWGRRLHAIDCQGLFCETDKYCREAIPDLTSARKRIKARFAPSPGALRLFFPPKWDLNQRLNSAVLPGARSGLFESTNQSFAADSQR